MRPLLLGLLSIGSIIICVYYFKEGNYLCSVLLSAIAGCWTMNFIYSL